MASNGTTTVIRNGTLIDAAGNPPTPNEAVVIEGNRIRSVGGLPPDVNLEDREVNVIDATGRWIMPGLIDAHCHLSFGNPPMTGVPTAKGTTSPEFSTLRAARNLESHTRLRRDERVLAGGHLVHRYSPARRREFRPHTRVRASTVRGALSPPMAAFWTTSHLGQAARSMCSQSCATAWTR